MLSLSHGNMSSSHTYSIGVNIENLSNHSPAVITTTADDVVVIARELCARDVCRVSDVTDTACLHFVE
jgi:hypothetical protein